MLLPTLFAKALMQSAIEGVLLAAVCLDCLGTLCQGGAIIPIPNPAEFM